jgi:PAS domain S-box-containing protein
MMKDAFGSNWLERWITPLPDDNRSALRFWQERVIYTFLAIGVTFGMVVLVPSVLLSLKEGLIALAVIDIAVYVWCLIVFFRRSWSYVVRVTSIIGVSYVLGLELLWVTGPFGGGPSWLYFFPVVTGLLLNIRYAVIALIINALTLLVFGWLIVTGYYVWPFAETHPMETWAVIGLNFLLLNAITTIAVAIVVRGLQSSLEEKKNVLDLLKNGNVELTAANVRLREEIVARRNAQESLQKSEAALKESEIRFQELVNMLPLAYLLIDSQLAIRFVNRKAIESFGFSEDHLNSQIGSQVLEMLVPGDRQKVMETIVQALSGNDAGWLPYTALTYQEREFPVEISVTPVFKGKEVVAVQGLMVDVSDRLEKERFKREKEIAERTNRAISDWVGFIAHEIRTPISAPLSYSRMGLKKLAPQRIVNLFSQTEQKLQQSGRWVDPIAESVAGELERLETTIMLEAEGLTRFFQRILTASERLQHLVNELLDLSKLESGQMTFEMHKIDLRAVIQEAVLELEGLLIEKQLHVEVSEDDTDPKIEGDCFRIGQIIRNLLSNAIKFTPEGGTVTITLAADEIRRGRRSYDYREPALRVTVIDEGIGIPADQLATVFEKFKQSRKTRKGEGTGLGLPICREIVAAHGGRIWVESIENRGSSFHFSLPCIQERLPNENPLDKEPAITGSVSLSDRAPVAETSYR